MSSLYDELRKAEAVRKKMPFRGNPSSVPGGSSEGSFGKIKVAILVIAVIIVIAFAFYRIRSLMAGTNNPVTPAGVETPITSPKPAGNATKPVEQPSTPPAPYVLNGIIIDGANSFVIINGKILKRGGTIGDLVLKKFSSREAELENTKDNTTQVLKLLFR